MKLTSVLVSTTVEFQLSVIDIHRDVVCGTIISLVFYTNSDKHIEQLFHQYWSESSPKHKLCSPCSPWWPFPYLLGVGRVLRLHSFRSRATSLVTPTSVMSSLSCWCHVFLGRLRRLAPGIARFITMRVTLLASRLWTCPNQRRRPPCITSSIYL